MSKKYFLSCVLVCTIYNSIAINVTITSRSITNYLEQYKAYRSVVMIHLKIPQDTIFASFKFIADEKNLNIFQCLPRVVDLYMKHGAPPVINPDGVPLPKLFRNINRSQLYNIKMKSDKKENFINITSPDPGSYYVVVFLAYSDPNKDPITQQGLRPECRASVEASLFVNKIDNPLMITEDNLFELISHSSESRYFKFFVPNLNDQAILLVNNIIFPDDADTLIIRLATNKPPTPEIHYKEEFVYSNVTFYTIMFSTDPDTWHYMEFRFTGNFDNTTSGNLTFQLKFISNQLAEYSNYYRDFHDENSFNNSVSKIFHNYRITDLVPYKHYDLIREAKSETFLFSFALEQELEYNSPLPINMTNSHFNLLTFKVRDGADVGATLQYILEFKSNKKATNFEPDVENQVIVACIRQGAIEVPTWPNKCVYNGFESPSQLVLNKTNITSTLLIPYPESGLWYATFKLFCGPCKPCLCPNSCQKEYKECVVDCELTCGASSQCQFCTSNCSQSILNSKDCENCDCDGPCLKDKNDTCKSSVNFDIGAHPCIFGRCSRNGNCRAMISDGVLFSTCSCYSKYRGWDCSDDSLTTPYYLLVTELLLLVLSNVVFLPAIFIAYRRKYYVEAITYSTICFISIFYHACDAGENIISFCLVRWSVLQYGDFFSAVLAFWVTFIAIADIPPLWTNVAHMVGAIFIALYTTLNKLSLWLFAIPVVVGVLVVAASWTMKYRKVGKRFVNRRYLYINWPIGITAIIIGIICFCFLQTEENYKYIHSVWHIVSAVALLAMLPKRNTFLPEAIL